MMLLETDFSSPELVLAGKMPVTRTLPFSSCSSSTLSMLTSRVYLKHDSDPMKSPFMDTQADMLAARTLILWNYPYEYSGLHVISKETARSSYIA